MHNIGSSHVKALTLVLGIASTMMLFAPTAGADSPLAPTGKMYGNGTNDDPFTPGSCDFGTNPNGNQHCTATFVARTLEKLQSTTVPAYHCPDDAPYLINAPFSPGAIVPNGVEALTPGQVGINITGVIYHRMGSPTEPDTHFYAGGTRSGFFDSGVTNADGSPGVYQIRLHCTPERALSWSR